MSPTAPAASRYIHGGNMLINRAVAPPDLGSRAEGAGAAAAPATSVDGGGSGGASVAGAGRPCRRKS